MYTQYSNYIAIYGAIITYLHHYSDIILQTTYSILRISVFKNYQKFTLTEYFMDKFANSS